MKENNISFHLFPRKNSGFAYIMNAFGNREKMKHRKAWEHVLRMGNPVTNYMRVCSKHFRRVDYLCEFSKKPMLKKTAMASQSLPKPSKQNYINAVIKWCDKQL